MRSKRFATLFLSLLMLTGIFTVAASAAEPTPSDMIDIYESVDDPAAFYQTNQGAINALYDGLIRHEESIDLYSYRIPRSLIGKVVQFTIRTHPELFFATGGISYGLDGSDYVTSVTPKYHFDKNKSEEMLAGFYDKADGYLAALNDDMDDITKAIVLHDALALNSYYQITAPDGTRCSNYTLMVEGWGKCENYSECYAYLLAQAGIKSEIITSTAMNHEWMKINLGGSEHYFNVDLTYDDPIPDRKGKVSHSFFLLSDSAFQTEDQSTGRGEAHHGYSYIHSGDARYDGYDDLHKTDKPFFYINGELYTLYTDGRLGYIATYDSSDDSFTNLVTINDRWSYGSFGSWRGNYSGIGEYGGLLYFNGENCVYVYDPATGEKTTYIDKALSDGKQLYGLYIENGVLIGLEADTPNDDATEIELGECIMTPEYPVEIADGIIRGTVTASVEKAKAGDTVTLTVEPEDGFAVSSVRYNDTEIVPENGEYSFVMPDEAVQITAGFDFADGVGARLAGNTLSLDGDIGVNFYMELSDSAASHADTAYMQFTFTRNGSKVTQKVHVKDAVKKASGPNTYYLFKCRVFAEEMTTVIKARMIDGGLQGTEYSYSVQDYAKYLLDNAYEDDGVTVNNQQYAEAVPLVRAMLNYGARSQTFFNSTNPPANSILENNSPENVDPSELAGYGEYQSTLSSSTAFKGSTLSLQSETTLSLYFESDDTLSFECGDYTVERAVNGNYQIARIRGIRSKDLLKSLTLTVTADNGEEQLPQGTISCSPMNYCYGVLSGSGYSYKLSDTVKSLYLYAKAAAEYFPEAD